jgi:hypothetical protein
MRPLQTQCLRRQPLTPPTLPAKKSGEREKRPSLFRFALARGHDPRGLLADELPESQQALIAQVAFR